MKLATRTFKRDDWYITCPFGERINPVTHKKDFHSGCDYGTDKENWKQYALESGTVTRVGYNAKGYGHYMDIGKRKSINNTYINMTFHKKTANFVNKINNYASSTDYSLIDFHKPEYTSKN